jgi:hypothetical protein
MCSLIVLMRVQIVIKKSQYVLGSDFPMGEKIEGFKKYQFIIQKIYLFMYFKHLSNNKPISIYLY